MDAGEEMSVKCFWMETTDLAKRYLRRYRATHYLKDAEGNYLLNDQKQAIKTEENPCPGRYGYHNAENYIDLVSVKRDSRFTLHYNEELQEPAKFEGDSRWPVKCEACDYHYANSDEWQVNVDPIYLAEDGRSFTLDEAPAGAMYDAKWMSETWRGEDGLCLAVKLPGNHFWMVDGPASNCTLPEDKEHHCWVRHGQPPLITVDKDGKTCGAGAGSISIDQWHGFLRDGQLVDA